MSGRAPDLGILMALGSTALVAATPWLLEAGRDQLRVAGHRQEAAVIGALKTLNTAETLFREGDKDLDGTLDYGTLEELGQAGLIDEELARGERQGYRFELLVSPATPEFLWMAVANPAEPCPWDGPHRAFATNHSGCIYYTCDARVSLGDATCAIPSHVYPSSR